MTRRTRIAASTTKRSVAKLEEGERTVAYVRRIYGHVDEMKEVTTRRISYLAFHPKLEVASNHPYLRLGTNTAHQRRTRSQYKSRVRGHGRNASFFFPKDGISSIRLEYSDPEMDLRVDLVAKQGGKSGLTFGRKSGIEAVIRRYVLLPDQTTREMVVVSPNKHIPSPAGGDSGSAIFISLGAVIGVVTGGTEHPEGAGLPRFQGIDVTLATPFGRVLEDVASG